MDPKHLEELIAIERTYWWHVAKRRLVCDLLRRRFPPPRRLVEGGIGGGGNLQAFQTMGYQVTGFDLMPAAVEHCRALGIDDVHVHDLALPWPVADRAGVVVLLDVIEHVPDPVLVLRQAKEILEPGGGIIVTVPAHPLLMGPWDVMLGHYRRYTRALLKEHARGAGLRVRWMSHWNAFTFPAAVVVRLLDRWRKRPMVEFPAVSALTNRLLIAMAEVERRLMRAVTLPFGLSLAGVMSP